MGSISGREFDSRHLHSFCPHTPSKTTGSLRSLFSCKTYPKNITSKNLLKIYLRKPKINNQITAKEVRLISEKGENLGVVSLEKALKYAKEQNLDLIEVSKDSQPPVCKLMNFGKYLYNLQKKERHQRKGTKLGKIKNIRISLRISEHDLQTKINQAKKFLEKGYKVKIEVFLRGREKALLDIAKEKLGSVFEKINSEIPLKKEGEAKKNPRGMEIIISKNKNH